METFAVEPSASTDLATKTPKDTENSFLEGLGEVCEFMVEGWGLGLRA